MILAIDIGNTNIVLGCMDQGKCVFVERLSTVRTKTELEYAIDIKNVLDIYHIKRESLRGGIISSVVPQITTIVKLAAEKILRGEVLVVGAGIRTGLNIRIDNPAQLGSDLVVDSVAAIAGYPVPMLIFDMGTANATRVTETLSISSTAFNYSVGEQNYTGNGFRYATTTTGTGGNSIAYNNDTSGYTKGSFAGEIETTGEGDNQVNNVKSLIPIFNQKLTYNYNSGGNYSYSLVVNNIGVCVGDSLLPINS